MKKKWKYLLFTAIILILLIKVCIGFFTGNYTDEVYTAFSTSPGFVFNNEIFFTASYRLFRQPKGFRRFPDGGQSKRVFEAVYLINIKDGKAAEISRIHDFSISDSEIKYTRGVKDGKDLKLLISEIGSDNYYIVECLKRKKKAENISREQFDELEFTDSVLGISETKNLFSELIGGDDIPSPLKYADKRRKQYVKDVVSLKGDFYYRKAVIDILSESEISDIPELMKKHEESLKKGRLEYSIYSEDIKKYIEKRLGL